MRIEELARCKIKVYYSSSWYTNGSMQQPQATTGQRIPTSNLEESKPISCEVLLEGYWEAGFALTNAGHYYAHFYSDGSVDLIPVTDGDTMRKLTVEKSNSQRV